MRTMSPVNIEKCLLREMLLSQVSFRKDKNFKYINDYTFLEQSNYTHMFLLNYNFKQRICMQIANFL